MTGDPSSVASLLRERAGRSELWIRTSGSSMDPDVPDGAQVLVRPGSGAPRIGEVWVFVTGAGDVTVHRYLRRTRSARLVFVGDRTGSSDAPVDAEWLVGRAEAVDSGDERRALRRRDGVRPVGVAIVRGIRRRLAGRRSEMH